MFNLQGELLSSASVSNSNCQVSEREAWTECPGPVLTRVRQALGTALTHLSEAFLWLTHAASGAMQCAL